MKDGRWVERVRAREDSENVPTPSSTASNAALLYAESVLSMRSKAHTVVADAYDAGVESQEAALALAKESAARWQRDALRAQAEIEALKRKITNLERTVSSAVFDDPDEGMH